MASSNEKTSAVMQAHNPEAERYWFAREHKSVIFLIATLALIGGYLLFSVPNAVFPTTDFPRIMISVDNGVMPIDQMLVTITRPIEEAVSGVEGIQDVKSVTSRGSAGIDLYFSWRADMFRTLERVNAALARLAGTLPATARISSAQLEFSTFPIMGFGLTSETVSQRQLWEIATYEIKPRLASLAGVGTIVIQGGEAPEFHIVPDPAKLRAASVNVSDILAAVDRSNITESPGLFEQNHKLYLGLISGQAHNAQDISKIFVKNSPGGSPISVGYVSQVTPSFQPNFTIVTANGKPAVLININRQRGSNTLQVADSVKAEMSQFENILPPGVHISTFYDQSWIVRQSIHSVRDAIVIGLLLASAVLVLFLRDWGTSFIAGMVIPISLLVTFIVLKLLGESFDLMTLGGMAAAVGLIIDDAIVVLENVTLHREAGEGRYEAVAMTLRELSLPLVGSTLTPIVVFLPLIAITGVTGVFFRAMAVTIGAALLTSLALALTWTPTLCLYLLKKTAEEHHAPDEQHAAAVASSAERSGSSDEEVKQVEINRLLRAEEEHLMKGFFGGVIRFYEEWFRRSLKRPVWIPALAIILIVVSYVCYQHIGSDLLPKMDEGSFIIDYVTPPSSSLAETNRMVSHIVQIVRSLPEVASTSRRTGLQLGLAAVTEANTGDISVDLKTDRHRNIWAIMDEVRAKVADAEPAVEMEFTQKLQDMIGDLTNAPQPIDIMMFSPDAKVLDDLAPQVADAIGKIQVDGRSPVVDIDNGIESTTSGPAVSYEVNMAKAAHVGFTPQALADETEAMLDGVQALQPVVIGDRPYPVRIRYPPAIRSSIAAMNDTMLVGPDGQIANLGSLATMTELPGQTEILQDNQQRYVAVTARLEGLDMGHGIMEVKKVIAGMQLPASIRIEYGGLYQTQQQSFRDLTMVLCMAIVFVFLVLLFEFRNFSAPISILVSAILSTAGVFVALLMVGITFNLSSFMGLIMVIGIVAKNGILLLDAHEKFLSAGYSNEDSIFQAGRRRLRPIVMTAIAAVAGMIPLALAIGAGSEMLQPLAIAVIGGLVIAMVLSLFVTPTIYFYMTRKKAGAAS
ncbi:MAG TPA: efflux RND transporter permease subunit [Terriglobales bacterium]|nr:efflux RND transporter permease subunit [Terriglobales bacterium]